LVIASSSSSPYGLCGFNCFTVGDADGRGVGTPPLYEGDSVGVTVGAALGRAVGEGVGLPAK